VVGRTADARKGGEQVCLVDDVADDLAWLDDAGPPGHRRDPQGTLKVVALASPVQRLDHARRAVVGHRPLLPTIAERRVLDFLPTHAPLQEIAETLFVSRNTVKSHTLSIYRKLGVSSAATR